MSWRVRPATCPEVVQADDPSSSSTRSQSSFWRKHTCACRPPSPYFQDELRSLMIWRECSARNYKAITILANDVEKLAFISDVGDFGPCPALPANDRLYPILVDTECALLWFECQLRDGDKKPYEHAAANRCVQHRKWTWWPVVITGRSVDKYHENKECMVHPQLLAPHPPIPMPHLLPAACIL